MTGDFTKNVELKMFNLENLKLSNFQCLILTLRFSRLQFFNCTILKRF